jgi:hypothetical protein
MSADATLRYDFDVRPGSTYDRAARLIASTRLPGVVVDLGAGVGALADAVGRYGFDAIGFDADPANVEAMAVRGRRAVALDLLADDVVDRVIAAVAEVHGDRPVAAVAMLDVIEHLPDPERSIGLLSALVERLSSSGTAPLLVLSVPNVAHRDLAAKLLLGRWDVTPTGLLDSTHITLFTERRLVELLDWGGFAEVARDDVVFDRSEQRVDDLAVFGDTTLGRFLRRLRDHADDTGDVYQFVRSYELAPARPSATVVDPVADDHEPHVGDGAPFLSVIVRTRGDRPSLLDTLVSLAAQHDDDVEVLLMVHGDDASTSNVRSIVDDFDASFARRVIVHRVDGGGRSRPLNAALHTASGRYVAVLDDDDVVTSDWVGTFRRLADRHPGRTVRAATVVQWVEPDPSGDGIVPVSGFEAVYPARFDFLDTVRSNRTPLCGLAFPAASLRSAGVEFDDTLAVCEDWKFQLQVTTLTGVADDPSVTSVYRRWREGGGSQAEETFDTWVRSHERVVDDLDAEPVLLPPGSVRRIHELYRHIERLETELGRRDANDMPFRFPAS